MADIMTNFVLQTVKGICILLSDPSYPFVYLFGILIFYFVVCLFNKMFEWR